MRVLLVVALLGLAVTVTAHRPVKDSVDPASEALLWKAVNSRQLQAPLAFPAVNSENVTCKVWCNGDKHEMSSVGLDADTKSCVGTLKIFCKGGGEDACGLYAAKCEGKTTSIEGKDAVVSVCEGAFRNYAKVVIHPKNETKILKVVYAYGNVGTTTAIKANKTENSTMLPVTLGEGLAEEAEGSTMMEAAGQLWGLLGNDTIAEVRSEGFTGRFRGFKVKERSDTHGHPGAKCFELSDDEDDDMFDKIEGKVLKSLKKADMELLPASLPMGSQLSEVEDGHGHVEVTCNGRPAWGKGFFPCFGKLEVSAGGRRGGMHATCKGFYTGVIGKMCMGFSSVHVEDKHVNVYDFCRGKKSVRAYGRPGKGFAMAAWCKGKDLYIAKEPEKEE
ncbi:hypothetical protein WJX72_000521 [[Myrmecia] bisecta]|uniref:Uncharacterized protein n=1 Tax=[Myrmecia] bisecta TaxID=41462 RepID=A0AAW1P0P7_9CHLO